MQLKISFGLNFPTFHSSDLECGNVQYFCPRGAFYPLLVGGGNYSIGGSAHNRTRTAQVICPPGSYCQGAIPILCPMGRYGNRPGLSDSACSGTLLPTDSSTIIAFTT
jgi:hypothetical protein